MAKETESIQPFTGFSNRKGQKTGGIHASDPEGGVYKSIDGENTFLIKRDVKKLSNDIAEFMAAELFDELCPGSACALSLHKSTQTGKTFLASKFFKEGYRDLFSDLGKSDRNATLETVQSWLPETQQYVKRGIAKKDSNGEFVYQNYERATVASLLLGDKSVHSGNMGVVDRDGQKTLVRIDFGAAFRKLAPEINPKNSIRNRLKFEKNYFVRDHPKERTYSKEFAEELRRESQVDLTPRIEKSWAKLIENYDNPSERSAILKFGKQIGVPEDELTVANLGRIKEFFITRMQERQQSQLDVAFEIDLKLAINKDKSIDIPKLQAAIAENPKHAQFVSDNPKKLQLKFKLSKKQRAVFDNELANYQKNIATQKTAPAQQVTSTTELAQDRVVFANKTSSQIISKEQQAAKTLSLHDAVDPITLAVRNEIIITQHLLLQQEIASRMQGEAGPTFADKPLPEVQTYLKSAAGQETVAEVMKSPQMQEQMHAIEVSGYANIHNNFAKDFRDIEWQKASTSQIRTTPITNDNGQAVCTLKETTINEKPTEFTLSNGNTKTVSSYRHIDFPQELTANTGPMHLSIAAKGADGNNIAAKDAVYFTAHYNDEGKLTEVSSPTPIKFMGSGKDAVGYIERNGEIYTLPVTQGKYQEMMIEVAKNNGMNINISQEIAIGKEQVTPTPTITPEMLQGGIEQMAKKKQELESQQQEDINHSLPLKEQATKNLTELRGYFDKTLSKMEIEAIAYDITFEPEQYSELARQWHKLCDDSIKLLSSTNEDLTQGQLEDINEAILSIEKLVNPEYSDKFLQKQPEFLHKWITELPTIGGTLVKASDLLTQETGNTQEHNAVINGDINALLQVNERGIIRCEAGSLQTPNKDGLTPLMIAIQSENIEMLSAMVHIGVKLDNANLGCTAIDLAINTNNADVVKTLLGERDPSGKHYQRIISKEYFDYVLDNGDTLLIAAIKSGNFESAKALMELGADINKPGTKNISPVQHAAVAIIKEGVISNNDSINESTKFFEHILDKGANVFHKNEKGTSLKDSISILKNIHKKTPGRQSESAEKMLIASYKKKGPSRWKKLVNSLFKPKQRIGADARKPEAERIVGNSKAKIALETIKSKVSVYKVKSVMHAEKITPVKMPQKSRLTAEQQQLIAAKANQKPNGMQY